ncbi:MAG TPA: ABC transporter permease [Thermomicrobiales bacterium]|nr:ABC transporter permease [Thermomicrobiales bacterium]
MNELTSATNRWSFSRFTALTETELKALGSEGKTRLGSLLLEPIVQLMLLAAGLQGLVGNPNDFFHGHSYLMFVLPGLFGLQALQAFSRTMYRTVLDRQWGMLTIKRLAGAGGAGYAASKIAAPGFAVVCQVSVMAIAALMLGGAFSARRFLGAMMITLLAVVFWASLAIVVTAFARDYVVRDTIVKWMMLPMSLSAPVFYPLETAPVYLQWIARVNPLAYQVQAIRTMLLEGDIGATTLIMATLTVLATIAATLSVSWGDALTSEGGR